MAVKIIGISHYFPERQRDSLEVESIIKENNPHIRITSGLIQKITGIKSRPLAADEEFSSTMAIQAIKKLTTKKDVDISDVDLLIFASATQDLIEPATSHIIQEAIGTSAHCFDIKNACNSFINGLEVAQTFIENGRYTKALVVTGEKPSVSFKQKLQDRDDLKNSFAGYTFGDSGSAFLLQKDSDENHNSFLFQKSIALSKYWSAGRLPGGGTRHPRGDEYSYFHGGGEALKEAFNDLGSDFLQSCLQESNFDYSDFAKIYIHQVSESFLVDFIGITQIPAAKVKITIKEYGNLASSSLPVGISLSIENGEIKPGDRILLIGLAGGISLSVSILKI
ncbi:MAG: ketoacyl-ACP synthase III [Patescibacteria group bacterium]